MIMNGDGFDPRAKLFNVVKVEPDYHGNGSVQD